MDSSMSCTIAIATLTCPAADDDDDDDDDDNDDKMTTQEK
jgi:hypothetical protein